MLKKIRVLVEGAEIIGLALSAMLSKAGVAFSHIDKAAALPEIDTGVIIPGHAVKTLEAMGFGEKLKTGGHPFHLIDYQDAMGHSLGARSISREPFNGQRFYCMPIEQFRAMFEAVSNTGIHHGTHIVDLLQTPEGAKVVFNDDRLPEQTYDLVVSTTADAGLRRFGTAEGGDIIDHGITTFKFRVPYPVKDMCPIHMIAAGTEFSAYPLSADAVLCRAHVHDPQQRMLQRDPREVIQQCFGKHGGRANGLLAALPGNANIQVQRETSIAKPRMLDDRLVYVGSAAHQMPSHLDLAIGEGLQDVIELVRALDACQIDRALPIWAESRAHQAMRSQADEVGHTKRMPSTSVTTPQLDMTSRFAALRKNGPANVQAWARVAYRNPSDAGDQMVRKLSQKNTKAAQP